MMTMIFITLCGFFMVLWLKVFIADNKFVQAEAFEKEGRFREACYFYGVALYNSTTRQKESRSRIRALWQKHGPFDYMDIDADACRFNAQGHSETLKLITAIVTGK